MEFSSVIYRNHLHKSKNVQQIVQLLPLLVAFIIPIFEKFILKYQLSYGNIIWLNK